MDAREDSLTNRNQALKNNVESGDVKATLSQMLYACKQLKTTTVSAQQIRENWYGGRPSNLELAEYLGAALQTKQIDLIGDLYNFPKGSEEALTLSPPQDKPRFLGRGFNCKHAEFSTRIFLGTANPKTYQ